MVQFSTVDLSILVEVVLPDELELLLQGDAAHAASETDGFLAYASAAACSGS